MTIFPFLLSVNTPSDCEALNESVLNVGHPLSDFNLFLRFISINCLFRTGEEVFGSGTVCIEKDLFQKNKFFIHNTLINNYLLKKTSGMSVLIASNVLTFQLLFMLGTLVISMAMQLDRRGLWNLLGPVLFALVIMVTSWVSLTFPLLQKNCFLLKQYFYFQCLMSATNVTLW